MMLKPIFYTLDLIREESTPSQVSMAIVAGAFFAISPLTSPQFWLAALTICLVRMNLLVLALSWAVFALGTFLLEAPLDALGHFLLVDSKSFTRFWAGLYHWPVFPFTQFNNTVVMGALAVFVVAAFPVYICSYFLYRSWSPLLFTRFQQTNFGMSIRSTLLFRRYAEYIAKK